MSQDVPEGWYPDPQHREVPGAERWWNGYQWTAHTRTVAPSYPAPGPPAPHQPTQYGAQSQDWRPRPAPPTRGSIDLPDGRRLADIGARLGAYLLDLVIVFVMVAPFRLIPGLVDDLGDGIPSARFGVIFNLGDSLEGALMLVVYVAYQVGFLRASGATPGRRMARIRVEPEPGPVGDRPDLGGLVLRSLVLAGPFYPQTFPILGVVGYFLPLVAIIQAANDPRRQGGHDRLAHTVVISRPH